MEQLNTICCFSFSSFSSLFLGDWIKTVVMSHRHSVNMPIRRSCSGEDRLTWRVQISQFSGTGVLWTPSGRSPARSLWLKALCFPSTLVLVNHTRHFFPLWARPLQSLYSPPGTNRITNFSAHRQRNVFSQWGASRWTQLPINSQLAAWLLHRQPSDQ